MGEREYLMVIKEIEDDHQVTNLEGGQTRLE